MSTPSEVLCRAADLIRDTAAAVSPGVWTAEDLAEHGHPGVWWVQCLQSDADGTVHSTIADLSSINSARDARWIALLSPAVAVPVERVLREAARQVQIATMVNGGGATSGRYIESKFGAQLALARVILGEEVAEDVC